MYIYYPISTTLTLVKPPIQYIDPNSSQVSVSISPTRTNATSAVTMSNIAQIVQNPDFYSNPNGWYYGSNTPKLIAKWYASDSGASGGIIDMYGDLSGSTGLFSISILTNVTIPDTKISSIYLIVTSGYWSQASWFTSYRANLFDPITNSNVWSQTLNPGRSSYSTDILSVSTNSISPGKTYVLNISLTTLVLGGIFGGGIVDYRVDSVYLYVFASDYVFSGPVIDINNTDSNVYYAHLTLYSGDIDPNLTANVTLTNINGESSLPIEIENGLVIQSETSEIQIPPPSKGYTSGYIAVNSHKSNQANSTLILSLTYCSEPHGMGVCVSYPFILILDPPSQTHRMLSLHTPNQFTMEPVELNVRLTNTYNFTLKAVLGAKDG